MGSDAYIEEKRVLVDCANPLFLDLIRNSDYTRKSLKDAIAEVTGVKYAIGPYKNGGDSAGEQKKPADELEKLLRQARDEGIRVEIKE